MKKIRGFISFVFVVILLIVGYVIYDGYSFHKETISAKPINVAIEEVKSKANYTTIDNIPDIYIKALVAVEDRRYYKHKGFDAIGTARAIYNDIKYKQLLEGGSTITQQLAKNLYYPMDASIKRKVAEVFTAFELEKKYSKEEMLEIYVNCVYYGSGYYSIYDASLGYFNKKPQELTDFQATLLVGIPNAPSIYSLDENPHLALERQLQVLSAMEECEYIDENELNLLKDAQKVFQ
ncbi:MAG: transglycosylase domain-containing protein [Eubacteriales bacterium]|nr:transglycosylase domain-containing protein [Eubacteriales bacterium]